MTRQFTDNELMEISRVLGDTTSGLTGNEIGRLLDSVGLTDPGPMTKRDRLHQALSDGQVRGGWQAVAKLIQAAMDPVRYRAEREQFEERQHELNKVLAFAGVRIRNDGKLEQVPMATTLTEAEQRASKLRAELVRRAMAGDVLSFCRPELLDGNYFHAVFEATKSVAEKLRVKTGLRSDGRKLVEQALSIKGGKTPLLAWNRLADENDQSEHSGISLMIAGVFSYFRNQLAHTPKAAFRNVTEAEALELLTILSFLHRRLDEAVPTDPSRLRG